MTPTIAKAQSAAAVLRLDAAMRAEVLSRPPSGTPGLRDARADALADLAELVLALIIEVLP